LTERDYASHDLAVADERTEERTAVLREAGAANVSDALGLALARAPGGTPGWVRGLASGAGPERFAGRAVTLRFEPSAPGARAGEAPFLAIDVILRCRPGDVLVFATGDAEVAFWGEHMAAQAVAAGLAGAVLDAAIRDTRAIERLGFPVFAAGVSPVTNLGRYRAVAYNGPVELRGVAIRPGDLVVADADGVVVVPRDRLDAVVDGLAKIAALERRAAGELAAGADPRAVQHDIGQGFIALSEQADQVVDSPRGRERDRNA
jgi:regulator of RNase E activity RraA